MQEATTTQPGSCQTTPGERIADTVMSGICWIVAVVLLYQLAKRIFT
jgi:hypothetical protein